MSQPKTSPSIDAAALADRLRTVRERIEAACARANRLPEEITLVGISKTFPLEASRVAFEHGIRDFGENRAGPLSEKATAWPGEYLGGEIRWHMVGHLQRNKAKDIVEHADVFHALDSPRLAKELNKRAGREERVLPCFVQVHISGEESKYGLDPEETHEYLDTLKDFPHLHVIGLMGLASFVDDPEDVRPQFQLLRELRDTYDDSDNPVVKMNALSMGMSNDFEVAIEEGATHLRLGTAIFGPRDY